MFEIVIYTLLGVGALLAAEAVYFLIRYSSEKERVRLRQRLRRVGQPGGGSLVKERRIARSAGLASLLRLFPVTTQMERMLLQTDLSWTVAQVIGMSLLLSVVIGGALGFFFPAMPLFSALGVVAGLAVPLVIVIASRNKRDKDITKQMPDALDMMARSLRAGHGISAGFKLVAEEMPPPIAVEFGRCFEEHNMGVDFRDAVQHMTERAPKNMDLKLFAVSLVIQAETGGNLAEILEKIGVTIRERYKFFGKLRALTAEVKVSASLISATPFVFAALITASRPEYLLPLMTTTTGRMMLAAAVGLWVVGWILIRSLSRVDV